MNVEYRVLGPLEVLRDGTPVPVPAGRGRVLLATLLLRPNRFVSVDELVDRLWDGEAVATFNRALALPHEQQPNSIKTVTLENLADAHALAGRPDEALAALEKALLIRKELGNEKEVERLRARIAELSQRPGVPGLRVGRR